MIIRVWSFGTVDYFQSEIWEKLEAFLFFVLLLILSFISFFTSFFINFTTYLRIWLSSYSPISFFLDLYMRKQRRKRESSSLTSLVTHKHIQCVRQSERLLSQHFSTYHINSATVKIAMKLLLISFSFKVFIVFNIFELFISGRIFIKVLCTYLLIL